MCWHFANARYFRIIQMIFFYRQCMANVFITCVILALFTVSWTVNLVIYCPKAVTLIQLFITIDEWRQPECIRVFPAHSLDRQEDSDIWRGECGYTLFAICHCRLPFVIPNRLRLLIIPDFCHCPGPRKWAKTIRWSIGKA